MTDEEAADAIDWTARALLAIDRSTDTPLDRVIDELDPGNRDTRCALQNIISSHSALLRLYARFDGTDYETVVMREAVLSRVVHAQVHSDYEAEGRCKTCGCVERHHPACSEVA